jgi:hypothetical protein
VLAGPRFGWVGQDLGRRSALDDHPTVEKADGVGYFSRETHLVRGHQDRHTLCLHLPDEGEHLAHELGVEGAGDLVEQ